MATVALRCILYLEHIGEKLMQGFVGHNIDTTSEVRFTNLLETNIDAYLANDVPNDRYYYYWEVT